MNFYDNADNVKQYLEMCEGYDGTNIYQTLLAHLPKSSSLLELGSGGGLDIEHLHRYYNVTGSDLSDEFLKICKEKYPKLPFLKVDALTLEVDEVFDCIYSNKVLHHLTEDALKTSLNQQMKVLKPKGIIAHSFWLGEENQTMNGLLFTYYNEKHLLDMISESFEVLTTLKYEEFEKDDSIFIIARLK